MGIRSIIAKSLAHSLPIKVNRVIGSLYGYVKRASKSYSLYGEDLVIGHYFHNIGVTKGVYVDVGAFHPKWISNTYLLSKENWKGVVVDLEEEKMKLFRYFRPNCKTICAAVAPFENQDDIEYYSFNRLLSEWDTISKDEAEMRRKKSKVNYKKIPIPTITINEVMSCAEEYAGQPVNYLNIDIEGMDEDILRSLDFDRYSVQYIQFENNIFCKGSKDVQKILLKNGYLHYATMGGTHTYVLADTLNLDVSDMEIVNV